MADRKPKIKKKVRAEKYEEKVHFDGTLEQMIAIAVKPKHSNKNEGNKI